MQSYLGQHHDEQDEYGRNEKEQRQMAGCIFRGHSCHIPPGLSLWSKQEKEILRGSSKHQTNVYDSETSNESLIEMMS